jgi:PAT family beta-lactamase induction signal transducer AmpG
MNRVGAPSPHHNPRWRENVREYIRPRTLTMLVLGFSSGLPFLLVGNTLGYWLRDEGTTLAAIGFLSWVGIAYSLKFLWAPIIDRARAPVFGKLGRRRGWMALAQVVVGAALILMSALGTSSGLVLLGAAALVVAFASATQDIVIDAWRIESAESGEELGLLSSAYQLGYRVALIATDAVILVAANHLGWRPSYAVYGVLMVIGLAATFFAAEPVNADAAIEARSEAAPLGSVRGLYDAIIGPFTAFFRAHGWLAFLMLAAISLYRLPDFLMGPMANPLYHDIGLSKDLVGSVRGTIGLVASFAGIAAGGFWALRFGFMSALIVGGILQALAVASFALLAHEGANMPVFVAVMTADNFGISFAGVALVSYMSSLTTLGYTATQYALLSSTYAWAGKIMKGFSGAIVEGLSAGHGLMGAYAIFFICAGLIGIPAILLFMLLSSHQRRLIQRA